MSTKISIRDLKEIISDYLKGEAIDIIELRLQKISLNSGCSCQIYFQAVTNLNTNDPYLNAIRKQLNIDTNSFNLLINKSKSLYDLLVNLAKADYHHLHFFLKLIDKTKPPKNWGLIFSLSAIVSATFGLFFHFNKRYFEMVANWVATTFPLAVRWLNKTFSVLRNISILGIIYNTIDLLAMWYHAFFNHTHNNTLKLSHLFFKTLQAGLTIAAYSLTCLAGGTLALPIAFLFVLSTSMDVFKSLFFRAYINKELSLLPKPKRDNSPWEALAENKRAENYLQHASQSVRLEIVAAMLTTIAVCIWSFSPPSLLIAISSFSFITLVSLAKKSFSELIERDYAERLQSELKEIEPAIDPELHPSHATILQLIKNKNEDLKGKEAELEHRKNELTALENDVLKRIIDLHENQPDNDRRSNNNQGFFADVQGHRRTQSLPSICCHPEL